MVFEEKEFIEFVKKSNVSTDDRFDHICNWVEVNIEDYETAETMLTSFRRLIDLIDVSQISKSAIKKFTRRSPILRLNPNIKKYLNQYFESVLVYGQAGYDRKTAVLTNMPQFHEGNPVNITLPYAWFRSVVSLNNKVYFAGGVSCDDDDVLQTVTVVDIQTGLVSEAPPLQTARKGAAITAWGDEIFVCGGLQSEEEGEGKTWLSSCECLSIGSESWSPMISLNKACQSAAAVMVVNCKTFLYRLPHILLTGGLDGEGALADAVMIGLNSSKPKWWPVASMNHARWDHGIALFNEYVFVAGGQGASNDELSSVEMWRPIRAFCDLGQWTELSPICQPSRWVSLAVFHNRLLAFDTGVEEFLGETSTETDELISAEKLKSFTWSPIEDRPDVLGWFESAVFVESKVAPAE